MFATLQNRLAKELKLAGITGIEAANVFIRDVYLFERNARFAVQPAAPGSTFVPIEGVNLGEILFVQEERQVGAADLEAANSPKPDAPAFRARVSRRMHLYPDGSRRIGRYDEKGRLRTPDARCAA